MIVQESNIDYPMQRYGKKAPPPPKPLITIRINLNKLLGEGCA